MAVVELRNVSKVYDNKLKVVSDVNLTINDKEFVVLVGPSGCGKSTTLRMIAGLEEITEGQIYIDDQLINDISPKERDIAMVFQNYALYPHMTVYENMAFGLKLRKFSKEDIKQRVNDAAKILDLEKYLDRKPKALSGGQRQRVAVGRAIVRKPKVFLFDEPLSNLDAKLRVQMRTEISKLHQKLEATMIYVTHDQTEAMTMGDRIVVMKDGIVNQVDTPMNLYNKPINQFVAGFIGSPAMNFLKGEVIKKDAIKLIVNKEIQLTIPSKFNSVLSKNLGKEITMGIRPEDISSTNDLNNVEFQKLKILVDVVEPMGNETFIYFNIDKKQFIVRVPSSNNYKAGEESDVFFNAGKAFYFDDEGNSLY
ncbi:MAG: sn-glycerol-3-phosphate ABC transporter ATP-binding protein UgpC [Ignavibacteriaceae bacterium]|nr:sn-glycerol-3-phosphate ABC transporter ATP-binding protein UgpC [Ignavibacteriaceae bacterium]